MKITLITNFKKGGVSIPECKLARTWNESELHALPFYVAEGELTGYCIILNKGEKNKVDLESGYSLQFEVIKIIFRKNKVLIKISSLLILRDNVPHPELSQGAVFETLVCAGEFKIV